MTLVPQELDTPLPGYQIIKGGEEIKVLLPPPSTVHALVERVGIGEYLDVAIRMSLFKCIDGCSQFCSLVSGMTDTFGDGLGIFTGIMKNHSFSTGGVVRPLHYLVTSLRSLNVFLCCRWDSICC